MLMSTPTINHLDVVEQLPPNSTLILHGVTWEEYEELLDAVGEAKGLRISYDQGTVQVMTLSVLHEAYQYLIHDLVALLSIRLRIKVLSFGSATMRKPIKLKGVEPDLQYYVQTAAAIGSRTDLDFAVDPAPDIVVEVDLQHQSFSKFPIYAAFAVPELWRYDGKLMTICCLEDEGYVSVSSSRSIPVLTSEILTEFLARVGRDDQYEIVLAFEEWLRTQQV
jgi:Uma2 family endonuclease